MNSIRSFFNAFILAVVAILATTAITSTTASAQVVVPAPVGLTITGWSQSDGIGTGYNVGGDGLGTVQTFSDGAWALGAKSFLTSNSNPNCTVDCSQTQSTLSIEGAHMSAARSTNQGFGTMTNPVTSQSKTSSFFSASMQQQWVPTVAPVVVPTAP